MVVAAQSTQLPSGPELALACAHVLVITMTLTEDDLATLAQFNAPTLGVSLYKVAPLVEDMKQRALAALDALTASQPTVCPTDKENPPAF